MITVIHEINEKETMNNSIISIMERTIIIAELDDTAEHVAEILDSQKISCMPVVDRSGKCFGVISAADFIHFYNTHKNPKTAHAWEICTHKVIEVQSDISIKEASELMLKNKIHHLVVTEENIIHGIISSIDLLRKCINNNA